MNVNSKVQGEMGEREDAEGFLSLIVIKHLTKVTRIRSCGGERNLWVKQWHGLDT